MHHRTARASRALALTVAGVLAACGSSSSTPEPSSPPAVTVSAVTVAPATTTLALGTSRSFTATARYSDGSQKDVTALAAWATSAEGVVRLAAGAPAVGTATGVGTAQVSATLAGVKGLATVTVTDAAVQALSLSPALTSLAAGFSGQLTATALFTDGSKADVTSAAEWTSTDATIAAVTAGRVTGGAAGQATVSVAYAGLTAALTVTVTPATLQSLVVTPGDTSLPLGVTLPLTVTGLFSDGRAQDLTGQVAWSSSAPAVATVSAAGVVSPVAAGTATLTATLSGRSATATVTVTAATLTAIDVFPGAVTLAKGTTAAFTAVGTFSDQSTLDVTASAQWSSSSTAVLLASAPGAEGVLGTAAAEGTAVVTASLGAVSGTAAVTITSATLVSLAVAPGSLSVPVGLDEPLVATGTFTDGSIQDLTLQVAWLSSDPDVAAVSNAPGSEGVVTAISSGAATITASIFGQSASAGVTVISAVLQSIAVTPVTAPAPIVPAGYQLRFAATGTYSDGSTYDLTSSAVWSSSRTAVATVTATGSSAGTATGIAPGTADITAALGGVAGSATLTVTNAKLVSVAVAPATFTVAVRGTQPLQATGTFNDGTTLDITRQCIFSSSSKAVAVVSRAGVVTGVAPGTATVTARRTGKRGQAAVTVLP